MGAPLLDHLLANHSRCPAHGSPDPAGPAPVRVPLSADRGVALEPRRPRSDPRGTNLEDLREIPEFRPELGLARASRRRASPGPRSAVGSASRVNAGANSGGSL